MSRLARARRQRHNRAERDRGAALVEFAFVAVLLFFLLFGIVIFGVLMSFKQNLVAAAADAAREAAVVFPGDHDGNGVEDREEVAEEALERALNAYDRSCYDPADGLTCTVTIGACADIPTNSCITVHVTYENNGSTAMFPSIPLLSGVVPEQLEAESIVKSR